MTDAQRYASELRQSAVQLALALWDVEEALEKLTTPQQQAAAAGVLARHGQLVNQHLYRAQATLEMVIPLINSAIRNSG